jgi:2-dehydro-3-deoxy-D-arabinonate dehydratase
MSVLLYKTKRGPLVAIDDETYSVEPTDWDSLLNLPDLPGQLQRRARPENRVALPERLEAPIGTQEVWGAGVTYFTSRNARMEESRPAGGGEFYNRVYDAAGRNCSPGDGMRVSPRRRHAPAPRLSVAGAGA